MTIVTFKQKWNNYYHVVLCTNDIDSELKFKLNLLHIESLQSLGYNFEYHFNYTVLLGPFS